MILYYNYNDTEQFFCFILELNDPKFKTKKKELDQGWKPYRINHLSWWKQELPLEAEMEEGRKNLEANNNTVDFVESHCCACGTVIGDFPDGIPKTDELRVQSYPELIDEFKQVSAYYISTNVCGRNYEYADDDKCAMWQYAHEHKIPEKLEELGIPDVAIQGEFCGAGIQKNRLKLARPEWYVFTVIDLANRRRYPLHKMQELCEQLQLKMVPIEEEREKFPYDSIEVLLERAKGKYDSGMNKEGIVIRPVEPIYSRIIQGPLSMKVLNNDYLLKE